MPSQRGNALFLILIAVALFAALSFAVTQSGRSSGAGISKEQTMLGVAQLTQIGADLHTAIMRMRASGIKLADIDIHTADPDAQGTSGSDVIPCTTGENCLFAPEGGSMTVPRLPSHIDKGSSGQPPHLAIYEASENMIIDGVAHNEPVILMFVWNLKEEACTLLNQGLGITSMPASVADPAPTTPFAAASGKSAACWKNGTTDPQQYVYYHVIGEP